MIESPIEFESWLAFFPNQELAAQIRRIVNDDYLQNSEELIYNCIAAYHKAQALFNLNPDNDIILETVSSPVTGTLTDTDVPNIKTQKTAYTISFVSKIEISESVIMGWKKPK
jgi:hypothetical protein